MTGGANHRENPITDSLGSRLPPVPSKSSPSPGELSRWCLLSDCPQGSQTPFTLPVLLLPGDPWSLAPAAEPTQRTMGSSQRQNTAGMSESMGQGKEGRAGNAAGCCCAIPANHTQIQMQTTRELFRGVYISAGFHSGPVMASHAKLISLGYSSKEGEPL